MSCISNSTLRLHTFQFILLYIVIGVHYGKCAFDLCVDHVSGTMITKAMYVDTQNARQGELTIYFLH